jgi:hypothetical protein
MFDLGRGLRLRPSAPRCTLPRLWMTVTNYRSDPLEMTVFFLSSSEIRLFYLSISPCVSLPPLSCYPYSVFCIFLKPSLHYATLFTFEEGGPQKSYLRNS